MMFKNVAKKEKLPKSVYEARLRNLEKKAFKLAQMEKAYYAFDSSVSEDDLNFLYSEFSHLVMSYFGYEFVYREKGGSFWTDIDGKEVK